jgi:2-oxoglutarate dehydrogenase E1 component
MSDPAPSGHRANLPAAQAVNGWSSAFVEDLYGKWKADPASVGESWNQFFLGFDLGAARPAPVATAAPGARPPAGAPSGEGAADIRAQQAVDALVEAYRTLGHLAADLDPLGSTRGPRPELALEAFGLTAADLPRHFATGTLPIGPTASLEAIVAFLQETYCGSVGVEFGYVDCPERRAWLQERVESTRARAALEPGTRRRLLERLHRSEVFEQFLATRYIGKKRFGLEGGDALLVILDQVLERAAQAGAERCVMGMAHRGRVNVLHHVAGKPAEQILTEFDEGWHEHYAHGGGDVKYHQGFTGDYQTERHGTVRVSICANPSHLEFVAPVATGRARALQEKVGTEGHARILPLLIHGDAALPGQGIVAETLNMAALDGYSVGGTIHVVINNQVGFTTDNRDSFAGPYCTGIAKSIAAPVIHVNGGDAEACAWAAQIAAEWRARFHDDIFVDMWCWRKNGHNETDEPTFTQPILYRRVRAAQPVAERYAARLVADGVASAAEFEAERAAIFAALDEAQQRVKAQPVRSGAPPFRGAWEGITATVTHDPVETGVPLGTLQKVARQLSALPPAFAAHRTVAKGIQARSQIEEGGVEWSMGELLAYGTLILEGASVRMTGQDVLRGTFSHRHAAVVEQETAQQWVALQHLAGAKGRFEIYNSPLTESACVGFEYGYSLADPMTLVIWEAQFGDFANGAQVMFDQFLSAGEAKWFRSSGLALFLPHGYEGQGPEHSSARMERFLALAAQDNIQVVYPTTSAQVFHMIRRQIRRNVRKPLVVMTPKSMLRLPAAQSPIGEFTSGQFQTVLPDPAKPDPAKVTRLVFCSGKVFHELHAQRQANGNAGVALVRLEQLYPFPADEVAAQLARYKKAEAVWVQEEPRNMGAWAFVQDQFLEKFDRRLAYIGRATMASPAVASSKVHAKEQAGVIAAAVGPAGAPHGASPGEPAARGRGAREPGARGAGEAPASNDGEDGQPASGAPRPGPSARARG